MLGIIFTGGQSPDTAAIQKLLKDKEALIIAADSGLICTENAGIKPDIIIGDMDSIEKEILSKYPKEIIHEYPADKDYTDTELAIQIALDKGCDCLWIIGGGGGRTDHLFAIRSLFERDFFPTRWITDKEDIYCIDSNSSHCSLLIAHCSLVSVFPLGDGPWKAESEGLKWPLDNVKWTRGFFGLSNVALDGEFSITAEQGRFLVILLYENFNAESAEARRVN